MLRLERISKIYPGNEVLRDVTWEVKAGDRIGLVGANGAGKSTQMKIAAGQIEPTTGDVIRPASLNIVYLNQEFEVDPTRTINEELWTVFEKANRIQNQINTLSYEMENADQHDLSKLINNLDRLQRQFEALGGYHLQSQIDKVIPDVGLEADDSERKVGDFSGGWQMRIGFAKILLQSPDILLLDEPTNHLDLESIEWLEGYLKSMKTPMVIISHDRQFLDLLCTQIIETERGRSTLYLGNYTQYLEQKELNISAQQSAFEHQQKEIKKQQEFVDRFRASATRSTQAKSRERQLEKIERIEAPIAKEKTLKFHFPPAPRSGREVITIEDMTYAYGDQLLFLGANLEVERGDRIAFLGPNGSGKSTLLRLINGEITPDDGLVNLGKHNVLPSYFEQNQAEALDLTLTVMETIQKAVPDWKNEEIRSLLGRFLFSGEQAFKPVSVLSGGEKARLALAKMLLQPANLLILDEPTNHLDIPAKEMLEEALREYEGTVLIVSHDRFFISRTATKIVELANGELNLFDGDYHYYLDKKEQERRKTIAAAKQAEREKKTAEKRAKQKQKEAERKAKKKQKLSI